MKYLLSGVGGIGLSALAWSLQKQGHKVYGSDRSYDQGLFPEKYKAIENMGVELVPQDGQLIAQGEIDVVVASAAVEPKIPDIAAALNNNTPVIKRAELLAELLNAQDKSVAIAGTSGKSTVTALVGYLAMACNLDPTIINGAVMPNFNAADDPQSSVFGNARTGDSNVFIAEACESDGSVVLYKPYISLVHNITLDHHPIDKLKPLFQQLIDHTQHVVVYNADDQNVMSLDLKRAKDSIGYSLNDDPHARFLAKNIILNKDGAQFDLIVGSDAYEVHSPMLGRHNVQNLLAAFAILESLGADIYDCIKVLPKFSGVKSRLEPVGKIDGITIIDDYAHNPDKIDAALSCITQHAGRVLAYYQPHGFAPTKLMKNGYIESFSKNLRSQDRLYLQEIYYAGGTTTKDISSAEIIDALRPRTQAVVKSYEQRDVLISDILKEAEEGDYILIMGARDDSIRYIGPELLKKLQHIRT